MTYLFCLHLLKRKLKRSGLMLKTFVFLQILPTAAFPFLLRDLLIVTAWIPETFTVTSEHIRFLLFSFYSVLRFLVVGSVRQIKLTQKSAYERTLS